MKCHRVKFGIKSLQMRTETLKKKRGHEFWTTSR